MKPQSPAPDPSAPNSIPVPGKNAAWPTSSPAMNARVTTASCEEKERNGDLEAEEQGDDEGDATKNENADGQAQTEKKTMQLPQTEGVRRSSRRTVATKPFDSGDLAPSTSNIATPGKTPPRKNPKRKASEPQQNLGVPASELLSEALRPLNSTDLEEWEGWVELESEPAFFTIILRDLGVENIKAQELFTLDQESIDFIPKPVYGLIFLFEYHPDLDEDFESEETGDLWFANQVTHNACATVALLNIVMNVPDLRLGPQLRKFKESTAGLSTALRGWKLSSNAFIRRTHNSFTRRIDHLNTDLALENEASRANSKRAKTAARAGKVARGKGGKKGKNARSSAYGNHYIAYVPAGGHVWELDGLKSSPRRLEAIGEEDWTTVARPHIQARVLQYEETALNFNLLALCQSPLVRYATNIAQAVSALRLLHLTLIGKVDFTSASPTDGLPFSIIPSSPLVLPEFGLSAVDIDHAEIPGRIKGFLSSPTDIKTDEAIDLHKELVVDAKAAIGEYRAELIAIADDDQRVQGRKRDYGPALHSWVTKLAEKGWLENMLADS